MAIWRVSINGEHRLASGKPERGPTHLLPAELNIDSILTRGSNLLEEFSGDTSGEAVPEGAYVLPPIGRQEVWAAGVTYEQSRLGRVEEAVQPDIYDLVYDHPRPELFFKANADRVRGPGEPIGIRYDSTWDAPEPELGLVITSDAEIVGYVIGNDVSSRSIEGENPLYLPQAKCYTGSCALGPCVVPLSEASHFEDLVIELEIHRSGDTVFEATAEVRRMRRRPEYLVDWLFSALEFPRGVILLTGTSIVPPAWFTLEADDVVTVSVVGLGVLRNRVEVVGQRDQRSASSEVAG